MSIISKATIISANPRSLDIFLIVQLCCTSYTTHCTICKFVHVNLDTAEILLPFLFAESIVVLFFLYTKTGCHVM